MSDLGKPFLKKSVKKLKKKTKSMSNCRMRTENQKREIETWFNQETRARMNY